MMYKLEKNIRLILENKKVLPLAVLEKLSFLFPDKMYLDIQFRLRMGYHLNLSNPQTFSEKLQWLKLYYREPKYRELVDKHEVKKYVAQNVGEQYIIRTLGVWDRLEQIDWERLPGQFVLKTTHGGGSYGVIICKDRQNFDKSEAIDRLRKALKQDIYKTFREWPYKNIEKRIMAEEFMAQEDGSDLIEYKFFCFKGVPVFLYVRWEDPFDGKKHVNYITRDWEQAPFYRPDCLPSSRLPQQPACFEDMCTLAGKLSNDIPFVRVDLYEINGKVFFSELTFYPSSGLLPFEPRDWDRRIGDLLELPQKDMLK